MKLRMPGIALASLLLVNCVQAQYTDTIRTSSFKDSLKPVVNWQTPSARHPFPVQSFIVPAAFIAYGVTSLENKTLKNWNSQIKGEVWEEHPHKNVSIDNYLQFAPAVAVYGLNAMGIRGQHSLRDRSMLYGMSMMITYGAVFSVKNYAGSERPDQSNRMSFPSGHTANAFAAAEFLRQEYKDVSPWYGVAGYAVAATTGYLRMYNNKHWFGDVVAGAGIGIASTKLAYWLYPAIKRTLFKDRNVSTMVMPAYTNGALGIGLVHNFR